MKPEALTKLNTLSTALHGEAVAAHRAFNEARELGASLASRSGVDAVKSELEELAPTGLQRNVRALRRRGGAPTTPSLDAVSNALRRGESEGVCAAVGQVLTPGSAASPGLSSRKKPLPNTSWPVDAEEVETFSQSIS